MKVVIVGGAGYIGSRLVPHLMAAGHELRVFDLLWFGNRLPADVPVIKKDAFEVTEGDLRGADAVIFLAGLSNDPMAEFSPAMNFIANGAAPTYLAYTAKRAGVRRFIYADSCSVYGFTGSELITEEAEPRSVHPYGISKLNGGFGAMCMQDDTFSVIALRQGTVSGWSPRMRFDLFINIMYAHARSSGKLTVNNAAIMRPLLPLTDAIEAYRVALEAPMSTSGVFNVAAENLSVGDAAKRIQKYFAEHHGKSIEIITKDIPDVRNYQVSTDKAQKILGVQFRGSVESVLADLDAHFETMPSFEDDQFNNVRTFKQILSVA